MKLTLNQLALSTAALVLVILLALLSLWYFQAQSSIAPAPLKSVTQTERQKPRKLTKEERLERQMRKQAEIIGMEPEEIRTPEKTPGTLIDQTIQHQSNRSTKDKMSDLINQRRKLEGMPVEHAEQAMNTVSKTMGIHSERATEVRKKVSPENFDTDSALIDSCERFPKKDGGWIYVVTLVDADGNSIDVEMYGEDGEKTWKTMQMIKEHPMMNSIYRKIVMPLLDKRAK